MTMLVAAASEIDCRLIVKLVGEGMVMMNWLEQMNASHVEFFLLVSHLPGGRKERYKRNKRNNLEDDRY